MRHTIGLTLSILLWTLLAPGRAQALENVTVQLNWLHQFEFAAFYVAQAKGYYREAGLEVTLREKRPEVSMTDEVIAGRADFGVDNSSLIISLYNRKPVVALAALMQHSAVALLADRAQGIEAVGDLEGKTIQCPVHACEEIRAFLKASGVRLESLRFVNETISPDPIERLKHAQATEIYSSNDGFKTIGNEHRFLMFVPQSAGIDFYGNVLFTSQRLLTLRPALVARFVESTLKGLDYALNNIPETVQLILDHHNSQGKSREHLVYEAEKLKQLTRTDLVDPGYMSLGRWRYIRDVYAGLGAVPADFDPEALLYTPVHPIPEWVLRVLFFAVLGAVVITFVSLWLARLNKTLAAEIAHRNAAEDALLRSHDEFRTFISQMSDMLQHELRTPLSAIKLNLDILSLRQAQPKGTYARNIEAAKLAVLRLDEVFSTAFTRIKSSATFSSSCFETIDVSQAIRLTTDEYIGVNQPIGSFRLTTPNHPVSVAISPVMFRTIAFNLIDNAEKYSPKGADILVSVRTEDGKVLIEIENPFDSLVGDNVEALFGRKVRGPNTEQDGTGNGLFLVHLIAISNKGEATIETTSSGTFRVTVSLPLAGETPSV